VATEGLVGIAFVIRCALFVRGLFRWRRVRLFWRLPVEIVRWGSIAALSKLTFLRAPEVRDLSKLPVMPSLSFVLQGGHDCAVLLLKRLVSSNVYWCRFHDGFGYLSGHTVVTTPGEGAGSREEGTDTRAPTIPGESTLSTPGSQSPFSWLQRRRPSPRHGGSAPTLMLSRPARRSLVVTACLIDGRNAARCLEGSDDFVNCNAASIASGRSEPVAGRSGYLWSPKTFSRRTLTPGFTPGFTPMLSWPPGLSFDTGFVQ
jgi:hypothetical protein